MIWNKNVLNTTLTCTERESDVSFCGLGLNQCGMFVCVRRVEDCPERPRPQPRPRRHALSSWSSAGDPHTRSSPCAPPACQEARTQERNMLYCTERIRLQKSAPWWRESQRMWSVIFAHKSKRLNIHVGPTTRGDKKVFLAEIYLF